MSTPEEPKPEKPRAEWPEIVGIALMILVVVPGSCGIMVGAFVWAARTVGGWP